jgi:3-oxoacyl-[acyl-carrier protein] reductase
MHEFFSGVMAGSENCAQEMHMTSNTRPLSEKVAVVTGAGRGIGRAIAIGFGKAGASVCCAARTESEIRETSSQIQIDGGKSIAKVTDVTNFEAVVDLFRFASEIFDGIDLVIINAGVSLDNKAIEESIPEKWRLNIEVNLIGAYHTAKASIPYLRKRGSGKIIFIGSGLGHRGVPKRSGYACSKSGVWMLTRILAQELLKYNICVNELIPGPVQTAIMKNDDTGFLSRIGKTEWIKKPEDVVNLALFIATQPIHGPTAQSYSLMRREC